jgi:uncharacterized protein (DUF983 family)
MCGAATLGRLSCRKAEVASALYTGLRGLCPKCGQGKLFDGYLTLVKNCAVCGEPWAETDIGDGAAVLIIFVVGAIVGGLALWTEMRFEPPVWLHMLLWLPLTLILCLGLLRPFKATLTALIWHNKAGLGEVDED